MASIMMTGANSFIGKNFMNYSRFNSIKEVSLLNSKPDEIDFSGIDVVLHLAAIVHASKRIPEENYYKINRDLCLDVAGQAKKKGVKHFILLSTTKVYGKFIPGSTPWNESSECFPDDSYGKSKYAAEVELKKTENTDFVVSILRTPIVYGDGVKANMFKIIQLIDSMPVLPFGRTKNCRHFSYIENLVGFIDQIIDSKASGTFIAMDEFEISTTQLVKLISKSLKRKVVLFNVPDIIIKAGFLILPVLFDRLYGSFRLDNTFTKNALNYTPRYSTEDGIENMVSYYKKQRK
jgi:nucleoside-diphosphate-sugar epimerase